MVGSSRESQFTQDEAEQNLSLALNIWTIFLSKGSLVQQLLHTPNIYPSITDMLGNSFIYMNMNMAPVGLKDQGEDSDFTGTKPLKFGH